ncbi:DUF5689 domain-containing protein [Psychroflexus aestuariivivens]|uniref:DUF5689 domain-containing protein n=1 Tax=Psychroflexus aestuariivivens TaxID=1795040 RepID=UPI000FDB2474|nr:DUF5689 domain-containing protein [Psychroflexus aestuariivivens]
MKTIKINFTFLFLLLTLGAITTSCVEDDDYNAPEFLETPPNIDPNDVITLSSVYSELAQNDNENFTFQQTGKYALAYVVSSDIGGNFFKELVVQDKPVNPTIGISIQANLNPLFTRYNFGRRVFIKLDGLTISQRRGGPTQFNEPRLGIDDGEDVAQIPEALVEEHIIRDVVVEGIVPTTLDIADLSEENLNTYIKLENVQFNRTYFGNEEPPTYASDAGDDFDGERILESCETNASTILSTSTFSDFKGLTLPSGSGSLNGILTRDFFGEFYTIYLNSPANVDMTGERCDPEVFECEGPTSSADEIFNEDFEGINNLNQLTDWVNVNVTGGDTDYFIGSFNNNNYAQVSGFNSEESDIEAWLITPEINLDASTQEEFTARIEAAFDNGNLLNVFITSAYTGDPTTTEWEGLDVNVPNGPAQGFGGLQDVGPINISCVEGESIRIGFRYIGSAPSSTTRYHIDDVNISGLLD